VDAIHQPIVAQDDLLIGQAVAGSHGYRPSRPPFLTMRSRRACTPGVSPLTSGAHGARSFRERVFLGKRLAHRCPTELQTRGDSVLGLMTRTSAISCNAMTDGIRGSGSAGVHAQFAADIPDVGRRRPWTDEQRRSDLPVRHTPDQQP